MSERIRKPLADPAASEKRVDRVGVVKGVIFYFRRMFRRQHTESDALLPLDLQRRMLEAELGRLEADIRMLTERRDMVKTRIGRCERVLNARRGRFRRVK